MNGRMWNSALGAWLGAWEDDAVIVGHLGEALSRCIVGPNSSEVAVSRAFKPCCSKTLHQTDLNCFEASKNSSRLLPILRNPHFLFHVDLNATKVSRLSLCITTLPELKFKMLVHLDSSDFWTGITQGVFLTVSMVLRSATCLSSTETVSIVLKNPGLSWLPLHSGMHLRGVLPLILKIM